MEKGESKSSHTSERAAGPDGIGRIGTHDVKPGA